MNHDPSDVEQIFAGSHRAAVNRPRSGNEAS
jgi:hypothetical protein